MQINNELLVVLKAVYTTAMQAELQVPEYSWEINYSKLKGTATRKYTAFIKLCKKHNLNHIEVAAFLYE